MWDQPSMIQLLFVRLDDGNRCVALSGYDFLNTCIALVDTCIALRCIQRCVA